MKFALKKSTLLLAILSIMLFSACHVEFSPNASWKDIPVVYGILDQDEDTTFIRIQRCYLGEGNNYEYAQLFDSINYSEGEIDVQMLEWEAVRGARNILSVSPYATAPKKIFHFEYHLLSDKEEGGFYAPHQPIYICNTKNQLDTSCVYQLLVINTASKDTLAKAQTYLIGDGLLLNQPSEVVGFAFTGTGTKYCNLEWTALPRARLYQPSVRFHYFEFIINNNNNVLDTVINRRYIDIDGNIIKNNLATRLITTRFEQSTFLNVIKDSIHDYSINKIAIDTIDLTIKCCTEDLAAYLFSHQENGSINQDRISYTNIEGGLGVFAARRSHIKYRLHTPASSNSQYKKDLEALGVGFYQGRN